MARGIRHGMILKCLREIAVRDDAIPYAIIQDPHRGEKDRPPPYCALEGFEVDLDRSTRCPRRTPRSRAKVRKLISASAPVTIPKVFDMALKALETEIRNQTPRNSTSSLPCRNASTRWRPSPTARVAARSDSRSSTSWTWSPPMSGGSLLETLPREDDAHTLQRVAKSEAFMRGGHATITTPINDGSSADWAAMAKVHTP